MDQSLNPRPEALKCWRKLKKKHLKIPISMDFLRKLKIEPHHRVISFYHDPPPEDGRANNVLFL